LNLSSKVDSDKIVKDLSVLRIPHPCSSCQTTKW